MFCFVMMMHYGENHQGYMEAVEADQPWSSLNSGAPRLGKKAFQRIQLWFTANTWCMFLKTRGHQVPLLPMPGPGPTVKVFASNVGQGVQPSDARGLVACSCDNSWLNKLSRSAWPLIAFLCSNGVLFARPCWAISMCWNPKVIRLNMV